MEMDGRNELTEIEEHTSLVDIKDDEQDTQQLVRDMKGKLQCLFDISEGCCIYRVPKDLRYTNEDAYVPRLVSLGPLHHGNIGLEAMEVHKWRCFRRFIIQNSIDLDALVRLMKEKEEKTRGFYADCIRLSSDEFVKVMLVDSIFVINFLLQCNNPNSVISVRSIYHKDFFEFRVLRDMMLLENQLPFFILQEILDFAKSTNGTTITERSSITELTHCLFGYDMNHESVTGLDSNEARHFVDFQRLIYLPGGERKKPNAETEFAKIKSITELYKAGVRFAATKTKSLDIDFEDGVLYIPSINVSDMTETFFRNLLAYDQFHGSSHISDYFGLMGMLIDTAEDVELLVKNKILRNELATEQEVSKVFNDLEKEVIYGASFYYSHLCQEINDYCETPWQKMMATLKNTWIDTLKQNYLANPWKVISVIAGSILLVLTVIQTVCSVISLKQP